MTELGFVFHLSSFVFFVVKCGRNGQDITESKRHYSCGRQEPPYGTR